MGAELFHANRQTDGYDETNSLFRNFSNAPKNRKNTQHMRNHKIKVAKLLFQN
jgi:hypothetical protein